MKTARMVEDGNGLELWRNYGEEFEPRIRGRFAAMMRTIMYSQFTAEAVKTDIDKWEKLVSDYEEQSGEVISDNLRQTILSTGVQDTDLNKHLALNASRLKTSVAIKKEIIDEGYRQAHENIDT